MKISIIIPVYNTDLYVGQCLDSCLDQGLSKDDYEIIVINDGSTDNSLDVISEYQERHKNIRVFTQENSGLSIARNNGLEYSTGDYVWFVDSDDVVKSRCVKKILSQCYKDNLDLLGIGAADMLGDELSRRMEYRLDGVNTGGYVLDQLAIQHCSPFTIYKRTFLNEHSLRFYPHVFHEDSEFAPRVYFFAKRVGFTNEIYYYVRRTPGSITRTANPKRSFDILKISESIDDFYKNVAKGSHSRFFHYHISMLLNNAYDYIGDNKEDIQKLSEVCFEKKYLFSHFSKSHLIKYRVEGALFSLFPRRTTALYKFLH